NQSETDPNQTLSLHDDLPIWGRIPALASPPERQKSMHSSTLPRLAGRSFLVCALAASFALRAQVADTGAHDAASASAAATDAPLDRKSTRLNSSHVKNSYAVF